MYYFIFPIVAVFLQGIRLGSISVIALLLVTLIIHEAGLFGFDDARYSFVFMSRIYSIFLIISTLSFLFAWFMEKAERELLLSKEDLERILHAHPLTGLSSRSFMERLLKLEHNRFKRYSYPFCLMAIKVDNYERMHQRYGIQYSNDILAQLTDMLMQTLCNVDIPARWDREVLLVMMPQSGLAEAGLMAERVREKIQRQASASGGFTVNIGISEIADNLDEAIASAGDNLRIAGQENGNSVVSSKAPGSEHYARSGLPDIYIGL